MYQACRGVVFLSENSVFELEHFLSDDQKQIFDNFVRKDDLKILQLKKKFRQDSYERLSFLNKDSFEIDTEIIKFEQEKDFRIAKQIRSLNDSLIVCAKWGESVKCACGTLLSSPVLCREKKICPTCNKIYSHSMMKNIYRVMTSIPDSYWAENVLTYPQNYFDEELLTKAEIFRLIFKQASDWIKKIYGKKTGCLMVCHSWGSKNPLSPGNHFHVHILIPDFVFFPITQKTQFPYEKTTVDVRKGIVKTFTSSDRTIVDYGQIKRLRFFKQDVELKKYRETWAEILQFYESEVNVYHEYFKCKKKLMHKITYMVRGAVKDFNDYFLKEENLTREMTSLDKVRFFYHVNFPHAFNRVRWYGFLCNSQRGKFLNFLIPTELRKMLDEVYKTFEVCPICFEQFNHYEAVTKEFDSKIMFRTLRMDLVIYENYHNFRSRASIKKGFDK